MQVEKEVSVKSSPLDGESAQYFRAQLLAAREAAAKDGEAFDGIIHVVERLGSFVSKKIESLGKYEGFLQSVAERSPLCADLPKQWRSFHAPFATLYAIVKDARNDAVHLGAFARHLTRHAIALALILEDALRMIEGGQRVSDFMIRNPICVSLWQPISFIRETMLTNAFSYLPVKNERDEWCLISDVAIATYLQGHSNAERYRRLATTLRDALAEISLLPTTLVDDDTLMTEAMSKFFGKPLLVIEAEPHKDLIGILTAFDLL